MKKIKVLQLCEDLSIGGIERLVETIAYCLPREKYALSVWSVSKGGEIAEAIKRSGIDVRIFNASSCYSPIAIIKITFLLRRENFDIVHTHGYFAGVLGRLSAKLAKVPVIFHHVHSTYWAYSKKVLFMEKALSGITDKIICCSNAVKSFVETGENIESEKTVTIYNGVRKNRQNFNEDDFKKSLGIAEGDILILCIGSLNPNKGHIYLLEAISEVKKFYSSFKCIIAGDGPSMESLEQYATRNGINRHIKFLGWRNDVSKILKISDIFILPTIEREGLGISVLEAMAYGKPVIASRVGGISEVVDDGVTGCLVAPKDPEKIAEALMGLIKDKDRREKFGNEGKLLFEKTFNADIMVAKLENLYNIVLKQKNGGSC